MINHDINKDLNTFLSFPDQAIPLTLKHKLRMILGSEPEKLGLLKLGKSLVF